MTAPAALAPGRKEVALWSMVSVLLLVVMCAVYVAHGFPDTGPLANPDNQSAVWYTVVLAAPYAFVVILCLQAHPSAFAFDFAKAVSNAAIIGILFLIVGGGVGFLLFLFMIPNPLVYIGMVVGQIGGQLQGPGLFALLALFVAQFALRYTAGRAVAPNAPDDSSKGRTLGYTTLLLPVFIYAHISVVRAGHERKAVEKSRAEIDSGAKARAKARRESINARDPLALSIARTWLHVCAHTGCLDSLKRAIAEAHLAFEYIPRGKHGYLAVIAADVDSGPRYVTDETGLVAKKVRPGSLGVSWSDKLKLVDSVYEDLDVTRNCLRDYLASEWREYPLHLPANVGCGLRGDTTVRHFRDRAPYRVIYASPRQRRGQLVKTFSLSARPVEYAKPYVRSFLLTQDSAYVTTANRAATRSDWSVSSCETDGYDLTCGQERQ